MPRARAPWWMFVVAASFLGYVALVPYQAYWGPFGVTGFAAELRGGGMVVLDVRPDSPAGQAGLQPGDRIVAVNGQVIRNVQDWQGIRANREVGRPERFEISRGKEPMQLLLTFDRIVWSGPVPRGALVPLAYLSVVLTSSILGLIIAFSRPYDPVARMGALVLAAGAIGLGLPDGWAVTWRRLPTLLGALLWIPHLSRFVIDGIVVTFFTVFPRRLFRARWPWWLLWTPVLVLLPWRVAAAYAVIYRPDHATGAPEWIFRASLVRTVAYLIGSLVALAVNYWRLEDLNQRRRLRVAVAGAVVSFLSAVALVMMQSSGRGTELVSILSFVAILLCLLFPLSFAYAILRHRLFDIHVMVRQGLQYAMARGVLLSLVPALGALLLLDLLWHGDQPLVRILAARGWVYGALAALAFMAHSSRRQWLEALDRRFFRERYDAQRLLREIAEEAREAHSFERVSPRVVARIEAALHPEFVALLVREPGEAAYRALAAAPAGHAPPPLPAASKLAALVRVLGKPLEVPHTESGWLQQQLPHEETDFLRRARIELLVPVATGSERMEALLALGIKRSEEPYTQEDQDLLVAIAASLELLLERPAVAPARPSNAFEECPQCGTCYDTGVGRCAREGASLVPVRLPRLLTARYRLERRRGRGGMGAVYEASDTALERRVAVKVIRDDLVASSEAAERFRLEARAAASFTHPNVVTVYDFGVAAETRAFLVMELLEGRTLREELRELKRLTPPRTVAILRGVCEAVDAAHRRHLIHRDLKPENVFLARDEAAEIPKVLDFGVAKFLPASTQATVDTGTGVLVGTLHYMSPEQLRGATVNPSWDLWALAVMTYEMLTGALPFGSSSSLEWQGAVLAGRVTPPTAHFPAAPARWQEFFAQVLSPDPSRRPGSARMLYSELEHALA